MELFKNYLKSLKPKYRAVGSFFIVVVVGGLSKNVDNQGWPMTKNTLKLPPKNGNLDQNIYDSKSHIWNSFFENIISGIQSFFLISDFLVESFKANKNLQKWSRFTIQFCSKNLTYFTNIKSLDMKNNMLPQHNQKPFWLYRFSASMFTAPFLDAQELHSWST